MEFFRKRSGIIRDASDAFDLGSKRVRDMKKVTKSLNDLRTIDKNVIGDFDAKLDSLIEETEQKIQSAQQVYQNFLQGDPISERLMALFAGKVGPEPGPDELIEMRKEADRRIKEKIPPGYMDERPGDYIVWKQALGYAKEKNLPLVFVTSEVKKDWWDRHEGKTAGPRLELLEEGHALTGQRVMIYKTLRFSELNEQRGGRAVDGSYADELSALHRERQMRDDLTRLQSEIPTWIASVEAIEKRIAEVDEELRMQGQNRISIKASHAGRSPLPDQSDEEFQEQWRSWLVRQGEMLRTADHDIAILNAARSELLAQRQHAAARINTLGSYWPVSYDTSS